VKRYVAEPHSDVVRETMQRADNWFICRVGHVETVRAVGLTAGRAALGRVREEWPAIGIVELDQRLVEHAAELTLAFDLRSIDALHLAAALVLPRDDLLLATWDRRLHAGAVASGLQVLPETLD
jgi:predicted nucleic acid-binding protein